MKTIELTKPTNQHLMQMIIIKADNLLATAHTQLNHAGKNYPLWKGWSMDHIIHMPKDFLNYLVAHNLSKESYNKYIKNGIKSGIVERMEDGIEVLFSEDHVLFFPESEFIDYVGDIYAENDRLYHGESSYLNIITARERIDNDWKDFGYDFLTDCVGVSEFVKI